MRRWIQATTLCLVMLLGSSCAGQSARETAGAVLHGTVGAPGYVMAYVGGWWVNILSYTTAWVSGEPEGDVGAWLSLDLGPTYSSMNTPWCWLYVGTEPEERELAADMAAGVHLRHEIGIRRMEVEWPPTFTFCRTNVGILWNRRGDESFPLEE